MLYQSPAISIPSSFSLSVLMAQILIMYKQKRSLTEGVAGSGLNKIRNIRYNFLSVIHVGSIVWRKEVYSSTLSSVNDVQSLQKLNKKHSNNIFICNARQSSFVWTKKATFNNLLVCDCLSKQERHWDHFPASSLSSSLSALELLSLTMFTHCV